MTRSCCTLITDRIQLQFQETTRLHDYGAVGNIKDNGDIEHPLLRSVEGNLATL